MKMIQTIPHILHKVITWYDTNMKKITTESGIRNTHDHRGGFHGPVILKRIFTDII